MQNKLSKEGHQETASTLEQTVDSFLDVKHPLQSSWTLWYFEQRDNKSWEDSQYEVFTFDTVSKVKRQQKVRLIIPASLSKVEDFWSLFNHICQPSEIKNGADYSLFKTGIRPQVSLSKGENFFAFISLKSQWEDKENKNGGRWMMTLTRVQRQVEFDRYWMDAVNYLKRFLRIFQLLVKFQLLSVIGETADSSKEICGVVANNRNRGDKISKFYNQS